jgi:uncharacterized Rmd1/YagE family protein
MLVLPTLEFDYQITTVSDALSASASTFCQWFLIAFLGFEPCLSFGIAHLTSAVVRWLVVTGYCVRDGYDLSVVVEKVEGEDGKMVYVLDEMVSLSKQIGVLTFVVIFSKELYFIGFLSKAGFNGELTLIRNFGNLASLFIFTPINVTKKYL